MNRVSYIITAEECICNEPTTTSLKNARKVRKDLQHLEDTNASDDCPPRPVEIYRVERLS